MRIFITGKPGSGKSRLVKEVVDFLKKNRKNVAGILSPEIRKEGKRIGFYVEDIKTGAREILASITIKPHVVSKYGVNVEGVERIVNVVKAQIKKADFVVIDEIGKMEFLAECFRKFVDEVIKEEVNLIAVVHRDYSKRFSKYGDLVVLEKDNYDKARSSILKKLRKVLF